MYFLIVAANKQLFVCMRIGQYVVCRYLLDDMSLVIYDKDHLLASEYVMSIYQLKGRFQNLLRPISTGLVAHGVRANHVTVSAVVLSAVVAHLTARYAKNNSRWWCVLPAGLFVRMAMNAIDGMMAREHGQASALGAWLNEGGDIVSDVLLLSALLPHLDKDKKCMLYGVIMLSCLTELIAIFANIKTGKRANQGPMGKSDRAFLLGVLGLWLGVGRRIDAKYQVFLLFAVQLLLAKTIYNRNMMILTNT